MSEAIVGRAPLKYRPDIDGLRAVAVLSVLAYHIGLSVTRGGYVGVDVFFVISGYLISSIVFSEIAASKFSIVGFYERRIRRIFPALFGMFAVFSIFAALFLFPTELVEVGKSMLAATASVSNLYFWQHSGYFDSPTSQPLLHTWSLAVEEQFYIFFPLFLVLIRKLFPQRLRTSVLVLCFVSFLISAIVVFRNQSTAFYMPYTRAWELLLGTILSLGMFPRLNSMWQRNVATLAGIGLILFSIVYYRQDTIFPGLTALVPCIGSALIIGVGESGPSLVGGLLSWRPVVFTGLISYSLYLWHWPIIVFQQMGLLIGIGSIPWNPFGSLLTVNRFNMFVEVALSFLLAILTWRFVERPFRSGPLRLSGRPLFAMAGGAMIVFLGVSTWTVFSSGFKGRFPADAVRVISILDRDGEDKSMRTGTCFITSDYHFETFDRKLCLAEDRGKPDYLVLGDSHSAMLWSAIAESLRDANVMQASTFNCQPLIRPSGFPECRKMMTYIFQTYLPEHQVQGLFLIARWSEKDMDALTETIAWAKQHRVPVTVFGPVPEYDEPLPRLLAYSITWKQPSLVSQHRLSGNAFLDAKMQEMATAVWHVPYVSLYQEICGPSGCTEYADEAHTIPLMIDTNHLSRPGASLVMRRLVEKRELAW